MPAAKKRGAASSGTVAIGGNALPWCDATAFAEAMLAWEMRSYHLAGRQPGPVLRPRHAGRGRLPAPERAACARASSAPRASSAIALRSSCCRPARDLHAGRRTPAELRRGRAYLRSDAGHLRGLWLPTGRCRRAASPGGQRSCWSRRAPCPDAPAFRACGSSGALPTLPAGPCDAWSIDRNLSTGAQLRRNGPPCPHRVRACWRWQCCYSPAARRPRAGRSAGDPHRRGRARLAHRHLPAYPDAGERVRALASGFDGARFLCFGFGERQFVMAREHGVLATLSALLPSRAALLMTVLNAPPEAPSARGR